MESEPYKTLTSKRSLGYEWQVEQTLSLPDLGIS